MSSEWRKTWNATLLDTALDERRRTLARWISRRGEAPIYDRRVTRDSDRASRHCRVVLWLLWANGRLTSQLRHQGAFDWVSAWRYPVALSMQKQSWSYWNYAQTIEDNLQALLAWIGQKAVYIIGVLAHARAREWVSKLGSRSQTDLASSEGSSK